MFKCACDLIIYYIFYQQIGAIKVNRPLRRLPRSFERLYQRLSGVNGCRSYRLLLPPLLKRTCESRAYQQPFSKTKYSLSGNRKRLRSSSISIKRLRNSQVSSKNNGRIVTKTIDSNTTSKSCC